MYKSEFEEDEYHDEEDINANGDPDGIHLLIGISLMLMTMTMKTTMMMTTASKEAMHNLEIHGGFDSHLSFKRKK